MEDFSFFVERDLGACIVDSQINKLGVVVEVFLDLVCAPIELIGRQPCSVCDVVAPPAIVIEPFRVRDVAGVEENQKNRENDREYGRSDEWQSVPVLM